MIAKNLTFNNNNVSFDGGNISSDAGHILLQNYVAQTEITSIFKTLTFKNDRAHEKYSNDAIAAQIFSNILMGISSSSNRSQIAWDPLFFNQPVPSQSTESRLYPRVTPETNEQLHSYLTSTATNFILKNCAKKGKNPILDIDSTLIPSYGHQEASAYISHYAEVGYHPLNVNEFNTKLLLGSLLRTGSAGSSNGAVEMFERFLPNLSAHSDKTIYVRGDAAFYMKDLMSYLEGFDNVKYGFRAKDFDSVFKACESDFFENNSLEEVYNYTSNKPFYGSTTYKMSGTNIVRRIVYKAYFVNEENGIQSLFPIIFAVITNDEDKSPEEAIKFYCARATSENFTKELKDDFNAHKLSHKHFIMNEFDYLMRSFAYNVFHMFQLDILEGEDQKIRMNTYRLRFQKIGGKIVMHARQIFLKLSSSYLFKDRFMLYLNKIQSLA